MSLLRGRIYNRRKKARGEHSGNQYTMEKDQNDPFPRRSTAETLAENHGVSAPTIKRDGKFAESVDALKAYAVLHSVGANAAHGLRRSNEDKRRAVATLVEDPEWSAWSNSEIARRCGVSDKTVAAVRSDLSPEIPKMRTVQRGGTTGAPPAGLPGAFCGMLLAALGV